MRVFSSLLFLLIVSAACSGERPAGSDTQQVEIAPEIIDGRRALGRLMGPLELSREAAIRTAVADFTRRHAAGEADADAYYAGLVRIFDEFFANDPDFLGGIEAADPERAAAIRAAMKDLRAASRPL